MTKICQLYLEAEQMSAWQRTKGQLHQIACFADTPAGQDSFSAFLATHRNTRFSLLVNLPDEHFITESLPRLPANERRQLLEIKLSRHFPDTPWHCANISPRRQHGETNLLLMALVKTPTLTQWTEKLKAANSLLSSVHSLPQLLPKLLKKYAPDNPSLLALSLHDDAARFTLLSNGRLHTSRLIPLTDSGTLADEYRRFFDYLARQCKIEIDIPLCLIGEIERIDQIDLPNIIARVITPRHTPTHNSASLFLSLARRQWPREQLAPAPLRQPNKQKSQTDWLWRSTALALLIAISLLFEALYQHKIIQATISQEQRKVQTIAQEIQHNDQALNGSRLKRQQLQQLAQDYPNLLKHGAAFDASLHLLSQILDKSPSITVKHIDWKIDTFPPSTATLHVDVQVTGSDGALANTAFHNFSESLKQAQIISPSKSPATTTKLAERTLALKLSATRTP